MQLQLTRHRRFRRLHRHHHDVLEPRIVHDDVERDGATALIVGRVDDLSFRNEERLQKLRVDPVEHGVAVRAVDNRVVLRVQREGVPAHFNREFGRIGFAVDVDVIEGAAERAFGTQDAGDAVEDAQVGVLEIVCAA